MSYSLNVPVFFRTLFLFCAYYSILYLSLDNNYLFFFFDLSFCSVTCPHFLKFLLFCLIESLFCTLEVLLEYPTSPGRTPFLRSDALEAAWVCSGWAAQKGAGQAPGVQSLAGGGKEGPEAPPALCCTASQSPYFLHTLVPFFRDACALFLTLLVPHEQVHSGW